MSLILDALKRSEKERTTQESSLPNIFSEDAKSDNNRNYNLLKKFILPVILIFNLAILAYVLLPRLDNSDSSKNSTLPDSTDTAAILTGKDKYPDKIQNTEPDSKLSTKQEPGTTKPVESSSSRTKHQADALISQLPKANVPAQRPLIQALPKVVTKPKPAKTPVQQSISRVNTEKRINTNAEHIPETNGIENADEIKTIAELQNDNLSGKLSHYEINTHIYSSKPDRRFVLINMKKYREGQTLSGSNYKIDSITAEGVVIDHGNGLVLLKAR